MYFVKGMPESILAGCYSFVGVDGSLIPLEDDQRSLVLSQSRRMAASGLRCLAMAFGASLDHLTFAGIIGLEDPPRDGVVESVQKLRAGGVCVLMVTGDAKETALAVARRCGIIGPSDGCIMPLPSTTSSNRLPLAKSRSDDSLDTSSAPTTVDFNIEDIEFGASVSLSGADMDSIPVKNLADSITDIKVFYRVAPRHKLAIVRAFQTQRDIVAMTGDGVNDSTALKGANMVLPWGRREQMLRKKQQMLF
jgi:Ca2+-transporting ATPase